MEPTPEFRWQAFFRRSRDPIFLLNRQRRLVFVNRAWEELTGLAFARIRGLACTRRKAVVPSETDLVTRLLCPPTEAMQGRTAQVRRTGLSIDSVWDIDYLPFHEADQLIGVLGRITATSVPRTEEGPLAEKWLHLRAERGKRHRLESLPSQTPAMRRVVEQVRVAATVAVPVLFVGEPGVGKRWLARAVHQLGPRREEPFAVIDCGKLPVEELDRLLFGDRGLISSGRAGTVYLHDPALLSRDLQAKVVEALAETTARTPRLMAGAASDLAEEARSQRVLEEFRCRLGTLMIEVPPLRDRLADLPAFVDVFLERTSVKRLTLTAEAWVLLRGYVWPGHLRELSRVLAGACERAVDGRISPKELPAHLRQATKPATAKTPQPLPLATVLEEAERRLIQIALQRAEGNKTLAAELLGLWKPKLLRRMAALGLKDT